MGKITHADVRMYRMGTGDCFVVKFFADSTPPFTMLIDCGTWQGKRTHIEKFVRDLRAYVAESQPNQTPTIDLLIVTHEHKDHVYGFDTCRDLFTQNFLVRKIWMGWTEDDSPFSVGDSLGETVKQWKDEHGQRKKALNLAAQRFSELFGEQSGKKRSAQSANSLAGFRAHYATALNQFADLHFSARGGNYVGDLAGMRIVKKEITQNNNITITYLQPGQVISNPERAEGLRFYVLGPPTDIEAIKTEGSNKPEETFSHSQNNSRTDNDSFATAMLNVLEPQPTGRLLPFDEGYVTDQAMDCYEQDSWRTIEHDWLNSAGSLALRMNSTTNNLSLALAIEFIDSGRIMLFPGDAEYGSWKSWHDITWPQTDRFNENKPLKTEWLLNRTVFYKVAHHLSHNGTAKRLGVEMMTSPDLVAMATLDYDVISDGWTSTMPNRDLILDLLNRTKGRLIIMNEAKLSIDRNNPKDNPLGNKIQEVRTKLMNNAEYLAFENAFTKDEGPDKLYFQFRVDAGS